MGPATAPFRLRKTLTESTCITRASSFRVPARCPNHCDVRSQVDVSSGRATPCPANTAHNLGIGNCEACSDLLFLGTVSVFRVSWHRFENLLNFERARICLRFVLFLIFCLGSGCSAWQAQDSVTGFTCQILKTSEALKCWV
jgi:hypothetical protein